MRARHRAGLIAIATLICFLALSLQDSTAKGGRGKGGRDKGNAHAGAGQAKHQGSPAHDKLSGGRKAARERHSGGGSTLKATDHKWRTSREINDRWASDWESRGSHPWSMQRANETRKRDHRLSVADKLDELADRNGNQNLHDTAERMRDKAWDHYEKRLAKIDSKDRGGFGDDDGVIGDDDALLDDPTVFNPPGDIPSPGQRLTGRENGLFRQLESAERRLANRMTTAQRLWDAYEQSGDELLADSARAFEERALAQFEQRMDAISDFQQRHGLPTPPGFEAAPIGLPK